jgi:DNA polymerase-3 subunit epsilon
MGSLVYLDIETTGLDPLLHDVVDIAWAVEDGDIKSFVPEHNLAGADPAALRINRYFDRGLEIHRRGGELACVALELDLLRALDGSTVVGSNPAFDTAFLRRKLGVAMWHHRLIDVSNVAMMVFNWTRPSGLADVVEELRALGYTIPAPDHTAAGDVESTRAVYLALREIRSAS